MHGCGAVSDAFVHGFGAAMRSFKHFIVPILEKLRSLFERLVSPTFLLVSPLAEFLVPTFIGSHSFPLFGHVSHFSEPVESVLSGLLFTQSFFVFFGTPLAVSSLSLVCYSLRHFLSRSRNIFLR